MARRRPGQQPQRTISHPNDPEIAVVVEKPTEAEGDSLTLILMKSRTIRQVYGENSEPLFNNDGSRVMFVDQIWTHEAKVEQLRLVVRSWTKGIEDPSGSPLALSPETVGVLYEDWLSVEVGEPSSKKSFGQYIVDQMNTPGFFDPDPTVSGS